MKKPKYSLTHFRDARVEELVKKTDKRLLALWAIECTKRVLHFFEEEHPNDCRPQIALETLKMWIDTGSFKMVVIRKASLDAHAAARDVGEDNAARSAARSAGQAVATAHVFTHSMGAAIYAQQAICRAVKESDIDVALHKEREWQYKQLLKLTKKI